MTFQNRVKESCKFLFVIAGSILFSFMVTDDVRSQQIHLNEVMASNSTTIADEDGDYGDWIEIYNSGDGPIPLEGYGLSDDYDSPFRWVFPDTTLDSGAFMLIWATNKDRATPGSELHTNFAISAAGEEVILTHPDGTRIDELPPTEIPTDVSIGRFPDGTGDWVFFDEPTPGQPNSSEPIYGLLEEPAFSHEPGFYTDEFQLNISHPQQDVTIYYTLDGSEPTTSSLVYTGPITITNRSFEPNDISTIPTNFLTDWRKSVPPRTTIKKGTVIRTKSFKEGFNPHYSTKSYFVFPDGNNTHQLPVISISTDNKNLFDDEIGIYVPGNMYEEGNTNTGNYYGRGLEWEREAAFEFFEESGEFAFGQNIGVRIHGGFSRRFTQKSLRIYARNEYGESRFNYPVFPDQPYDSYNRLLIRNSGNDQAFSMLRDAIAHRLVSHLNMETSAYRPAILYINGEYWGLHNIRERLDRHYLERKYGVDPDRLDILTRHWTIVEGGNQEYAALLSFIRNQNLAHDQHYEYVKTRMDIDNYLDYFSAQIFFANTDWPHNNIDFWRTRRSYDPEAPIGHDGRWRWLFYDLDFSLGLVQKPDYNMLSWVTREIGYQGQVWPNQILRNLLENESFRIDFINRMADQLNTAFLPERMEAIIREMKEVIEPEMHDFGNRWRFPQSVAIWNNTINNIIEWTQQRNLYHWQNIQNHFGILSTENITISISDESLGHVIINSIDILPETPGIHQNAYPWTGTYFSGIPVTLKPVINPLYSFSHWLVDGEEVHTPVLQILPEDVDQVELVIKHQTVDDIESWRLKDEIYLLNQWGSDEPAGTYPQSMTFVYMSDPDPELNSEVSGLITGTYNHESRTRIIGLDEDGFAFLNTSNPDGNPGYPGTRLGGAMLVLDTRDLERAVVGWEAGTIVPNSKRYSIRLQYRTDPDDPFQDLPDPNGNVIEYESNEIAGHSRFIGPYPLPDDANGKERVELLWRYYYTGVQHDPESNQRSKLNISTIYVANVDLYQDLKPYSLTGKTYLFENWTENHPIGSYPESMVFVYMDDTDPGLNSRPLGNTNGVYDLDSRTRINGLGDDGFSFVNTSNFEGNPGYPGRRLGGAILSLNTQRQGSTVVEWTGGTVDPGSHIYHLRLQYRIGSEGEFQDVMDRFGNVVEYSRSDQAGHSEKIGPVQLPLETDDQPEIQLLWRYYYTGIRENEESGQRSELNISRINVWSQPLMDSEPGEPKEFKLYQNYPNPFYPQSTIRYDLPMDQHVRLDLYTVTGQHIKTLVDGPRRAGRHSVPVDASSLASGIYIYRLVSEEFNRIGKLSIIR